MLSLDMIMFGARIFDFYPNTPLKVASLSKNSNLPIITKFNVITVLKKNTHFGGAARGAGRWILS